MISLRPLSAADSEILEAWENDPEVWKYSSFPQGDGPPYSSRELAQFIDNQGDGQFRFVVCLDDRPVGFVDLFDVEAGSAGVGILIYGGGERRGYGTRAVRLLSELAFCELGLGELWCIVEAENVASIRLFERCGFVSSAGSRSGDLRRLFLQKNQRF